MKRLVLTTLLITACAQAPEPRATALPAQAPPPPPELSTIVIPVSASLAPLLPEVEKQIPKTLQSRSYQIDAAHHIAIKFQVAREPVGINMIGAGLHVSARSETPASPAASTSRCAT
jgi:hypothetical protein